MSDLGKRDNHRLEVAFFPGDMYKFPGGYWNQMNLGPAIPHLPNAQTRQQKIILRSMEFPGSLNRW